MFQKKSHTVKIKINYNAQALKNQKKKKLGKKKEAMLMPKKKKGQHCCPGKREGKKKNDLKWSYLCKLYHLVFLPPNLG